MVGSSVPVSSMRRRITSIDCSTVRCLSCVRPASLYPTVSVEPSAVISMPSVSTERSCSWARLDRTCIAQRHGHRVVPDREIRVADVRLAQHGAGVVLRGVEPLRDQLVHADFEQQVRAALQVEAERHRLLREPARHRIERGARHQAGNRQHRADQQHDEDDGSLPGREMQHGLRLGPLARPPQRSLAPFLFLLHRLRLAGNGGDGIAHDLDLHAIGDLDHQVVVGDMGDLAIDAAIGDDAVAALQGRDHGAMLLLLLLLRTDQQKPHDDEDEDERRERRDHLEAARRTPSGLCPSFRNEHERAP